MKSQGRTVHNSSTSYRATLITSLAEKKFCIGCFGIMGHPGPYAIIDRLQIGGYGFFRTQPHAIVADETVRQENGQRIKLDRRCRAIVAAVTAKGTSFWVNLSGRQDGFGLCNTELQHFWHMFCRLVIQRFNRQLLRTTRIGIVDNIQLPAVRPGPGHQYSDGQPQPGPAAATSESEPP